MALAGALVAVGLAAAGGAQELSLLPWPASVEARAGELAIREPPRVASAARCGARVERAARRIEARLARQTGLPLPSPRPAGRPALDVTCGSPGEPLPHVGMDEGYTLTVSPEGARLEAAEPWGALRGLETFAQLVEPGGSSAFRVRAVRIEDRPRFPWRGLMIDASRLFVPVEALERTLEGMAAVKLNVLHWRLTGDEGFRLESRRHPELHRLGSDGLYYTQAQVAAVVAYAADRGIRVVPEVDTPGPVASWLASHPELGAGPGSERTGRDGGALGAALDPSKEEVYRFLDGLLGEVADLFPDAYLHAGVDETRRASWEASERLLGFRKERGLQDDRALLAYFTRRVSGIVAGHGRRLIGGEGVLEPGLPKGTVFHSRRAAGALAAGTGLGYLAIESGGFSLDRMWPASHYYASDAPGERLPEAAGARVLGGEATVRAALPTPASLDSRLWPRAAAIAERLWSPGEVADVDDLYERLDAVGFALEWLGLEHRSGYERALQRLAGRQHEALRTLADVVEPAEAPEPPSLAPQALLGLAGAVPPESGVARAFGRQVEALLADPGRPGARDAIRARLREWQGLDNRLLPLLESRELLRECVPLAAEASAVAARGLAALECVGEGKGESCRSARAAGREPGSVCGLVVAYRPAVDRLVEAAAGR